MKGYEALHYSVTNQNHLHLLDVHDSKYQQKTSVYYKKVGPTFCINLLTLVFLLNVKTNKTTYFTSNLVRATCYLLLDEDQGSATLGGCLSKCHKGAS